jgi:hypothetical protein
MATRRIVFSNSDRTPIQEEALMSRIATITTIVALGLVPAAAAAQDLRSPDARDLSRPAITKVIDLRTPDARDVFTSPTARPATSNGHGLSAWAIVGIAAASLGSCGLLVLMTRRYRQVGRPVGA